MEPTEIIDVDTEVVACDGGEGALGHPRVFLNMKGETEIWVEASSKTPLEISGHVPKAGRVVLRLAAMGSS